jgi:HK97 family phage prohead protease
MNIERKFTPLKDLKLNDEGSGTIEGYRSVYGVIDEGGDIVLKGAFADTLDEYLHSGFTAHSHDWDFDKAVGFPVEAHEDDHGWFVRSQFHSTPDAQAIRTKAKERMDAGKTVGFSFGYAPTEYSYIDAKDYEAELPKYVKADALPAMQVKAQKFNRIRLLKKVEAIEDSIVTAPMNKRAAATAVKDEGGIPFGTVEINGKTIPTGGYGCLTCLAQFKKIEEASEHGKSCRAANAAKIATGKGMLADQLAQTTPSTWEIESAFRRVICKIAESAKNAPSIGESSFDWRAKVSEVISEYGPTMQPLILAQIEEFLNSTDDEFYLKGESVSGSFESFDDVVSALEKHTTKMQRNHENRVKEGRILSASNRAKVVAARDALDQLLTASEPPPKEKADDSINVGVLRTQSQRRHSVALAALAQV